MTLVDRAYIPAEAMAIMTARTLGNSHPILLRLFEAGMSVLDVGCGPGTLTAEVARRVAPGHVVGMDVNPEMIRAAEEANAPGRLANLVFYSRDIRESRWDGEFDLVNAARVLQWIPDPDTALARIARAAAPGGLVVILDFDHTRAEWSQPPAAWRRFYEAFLAWREGGGLDNAIARHLPALCEAAGLVDIRWTPQITTVRAGDVDFFRAAGLWRMLIESRGRQMVATGYLTEAKRRAAFDAFTEWMKRQDAVQTLHEACVVAHRPRPDRGTRSQRPAPLTLRSPLRGEGKDEGRTRGQGTRQDEETQHGPRHPRHLLEPARRRGQRAGGGACAHIIHLHRARGR